MDMQTINGEVEIAQDVQRKLEETEFVSLAEAARATKVPLTTLSSAVRSGRLPAVRVMPKRWLVRVSAVNAHFNKARSAISQDALDRLLIEQGLLMPRDKPYQKIKPFKAIKISGGKSATQLVIEGRRRIA
jgi:excisionase family DNA binding protein